MGNEINFDDDEYTVPGKLLTTAAGHAASDEIARLQARVAAWESALRTARLNNPYALDVFTPVPDADWARLDDLVQREFGHGIDRYSAAAMLRAWDGCTALIKEVAAEAIELIA
jgi:hypothetical protein